MQVVNVRSLGGATAGKRTESNDAQLQRSSHRKVKVIETRWDKVCSKQNGQELQVNAPPGPGAQKSGFRDIQVQQPLALLSLASAGPSLPYPQFCIHYHLLSA